jgi:hypothetical protein
MRVFGNLHSALATDLASLLDATASLTVPRAAAARSDTPFPGSQDLEYTLLPLLGERGFQHHVELLHPRTKERFEYDFFRPADGVAIEIMGYRADDEIYKDILKFHVHSGTRVGVVWVPRWKWISGRRQATNYAAAKKALAFADTYMNVEALVLVAYDWAEAELGTWHLVFPEE